MEQDWPVIVRFESQKALRHEQQGWRGLVTVIENIGVDANGNRYRFNSISWHDENGMAHMHYDNPWQYVKI